MKLTEQARQLIPTNKFKEIVDACQVLVNSVDQGITVSRDLDWSDRMIIRDVVKDYIQTSPAKTLRPGILHKLNRRTDHLFKNWIAAQGK